jgi:ATP-dependent Lon protease
MNPILFFDEVDKVSESAMGREIIGKLINLTDPNQNGTFSDHYFHSVPFDLSKAIIVFSFNDIKKIDRILLDRIKVIEMNTFTHTDKIELFSSHLMKSMLRENNFKDGEIIFTKNAINDLVHRCPEDGVRNLKRKLDTVLMKLNVLRFSPNPELSIDFSKTIHINTVMVQTLLDS